MVMASSKSQLHVDTEKLELALIRVIAAPRELVWEAYTTPAYIERWWGPRKYETKVLELDLRPGGRWRYLNIGEGKEHPFTGVYQEVVKPERLVTTFVYDVEGARDNPGLDVAIFEDLGDGRTKLITKAVFPTLAALQESLNSGMESGWVETIDRLEELLTTGSP
jgi:uncharacterized protein YndB with AHSA1/START domain